LRVLFDTNVVLDVLLDREPFVTPAAHLFSRVEQGALDGLLCATTITTVHYLASRVVGKERAQEEIVKLLALFEIAPVTRTVLETALTRGFSDFEDAVMHEAARHADVQALVTRDAKDFQKASLTVYSPTELVRALTTLR
jgi:predicted nucleic acid-binding protein